MPKSTLILRYFHIFHTLPIPFTVTLRLIAIAQSNHWNPNSFVSDTRRPIPSNIEAAFSSSTLWFAGFISPLPFLSKNQENTGLRYSCVSSNRLYLCRSWVLSGGSGVNRRDVYVRREGDLQGHDDYSDTIRNGRPRAHEGANRGKWRKERPSIIHESRITCSAALGSGNIY